MVHKRWDLSLVCCSMSMVSKTLCSHFSGQGSYYGYTHARTKPHNELMTRVPGIQVYKWSTSHVTSWPGNMISSCRLLQLLLWSQRVTCGSQDSGMTSCKLVERQIKSKSEVGGVLWCTCPKMKVWYFDIVILHINYTPSWDLLSLTSNTLCREEGCNHRVVTTAETWCDQSDSRSL